MNLNAGTTARWIISCLLVLGFVISAGVVWMVRGIAASLRHIASGLAQNGDQVAGASSQIAATSQSLSQGSSEQAASLEQISASMEEMTAMARRNTENSGEAAAMMNETAEQVDRSNVALGEMLTSMSSIKSSSERVAKIIKTIDEIAFQTNILALNAAVEAARAGEAGMGFAVVADEVRNLAQRSAVAARDTAVLIQEAIANSNQGAGKLDQVAASIRSITESAGKVKGLVEEVNESSKQQTIGVNEAATAITQVSKVTQSAAASAEESAAASEELSAQAASTRELVRHLSAMVDGNAESGHRSWPSRRQTSSVRTLKAAPQANSQATPSAAKRAAAPVLAPSTDQDPFPMDTTETGAFRSF
jgi:methyl-accepting chemotaxis protein/methyl-accepting chemotaxis protein-1 (serine sensor receptor)